MTRRTTALLLIALAATGCAATDAPLELPVPVVQPSPFAYPEDLWDRNIEGQAIVMVHVTTEGTVDTVYVRSTSGYAAMDSAAVTGARALRFNPGRRGSDPVDVWVRVPVRFSKSPPSEAELEAESKAESEAQGEQS